ncbi:MAG: class I SAM-dependent methyltransferase [Sulfolobales archaeon]
MSLYLIYRLISWAVNGVVFDLERFYRARLTLKRSRVLEISTGFSYNTFNLVRFVEDLEGFLVSVDIDEKAVAWASKVLRRYIMRGSLDLMICDARRMPFRDNSFEYLISHTTLHHIDDIERVLEEFLRIIRSGGRIVVVDLVPSILYTMIPGHDRRTLSTKMSRIMRFLEEKAEILERGLERGFYYIISTTRLRDS